ncbi:ATP-binding protein [uncultured Bartonella sp.]|uniref:ATP-binding protein n=1 Tax=uncultured Bartonella sp. TaxID=104108 RepID=UPI0025D3E717|nr:ATP-binding protein [uncultured Bartonella sp.]
MLNFRHKGKSLTRRVIVSATCANLVFWVIACLMAAFVMYEEYGESFDGTLQVTAERLLPLALQDVRDNDKDTDLLVKTDNHSTPAEYTTYQVLDRNGKMVMRSEDAPSNPYGVPLTTGFFKTKKWRVYSLVSEDGDYLIQVADRLSERREAAREAMTAMLIPALLIIPLSMLAIGFIVRNQLRPIKKLSETIGKKDTGNMQAIESRSMPDEFQPIIGSVNSLLAKLKAALEAERSFTSNSAHEIRTPIAAALAHTQVLIEETPSLYHPRAKEVENALQRLRRLSEKLLQLARADAQLGTSEKPVDLIPFIDAVIEDFNRANITKGRLVTTYYVTVLEKHLNGDAFGVIIRNLLENALNYSFEGSIVDISINKDKIVIANNCPVVSSTKIELLSQRFYRGDNHKEGSGLGLSIVEALAKTMPINISYSSPRENSSQGFEVTIKL